MKVLVVDSSAHTNMASLFELSTELILDPEIEVRFCKRSEDVIGYIRSFQPEAIIFSCKPGEAQSKRLIDKLHDLLPAGALMLYLDKDQLYVLGSTFMEFGAQRRDWLDEMHPTSIHDLAMAAMVSATGMHNG